VKGPADVGVDPGVAGGGLLLSLLIALLVPFPGTLFNKTVEANEEEISGWFERLKRRWRGLVGLVAVGPLGGAADRLGRSLGGGLLGVWVFLGLSALVYGFLNPSFGLDAQSLAMFLGLLVGLGFITAAFDLPLRVYHRRSTGELGRLRALWWTLAVAVICVLISRLVGFQPGYLYGLVVTIAFTSVISVRNEGIGVWLASAWLLGLSVIAWLLLAFTRSVGGDPWVTLVLQTALATFFVAGIEALAIGLLPMRFLPGHPLFEWNRLAWFPIFVAAVFAYVMVLVDPTNGYFSTGSSTPSIIGIVFLVAFGIVSVGTWAYFRYRPQRGGEDEPDRPGEAIEVAEATESAPGPEA